MPLRSQIVTLKDELGITHAQPPVYKGTAKPFESGRLETA
jgi:hypothetical protein